MPIILKRNMGLTSEKRDDVESYSNCVAMTSFSISYNTSRCQVTVPWVRVRVNPISSTSAVMRGTSRASQQLERIQQRQH